MNMVIYTSQGVQQTWDTGRSILSFCLLATPLLPFCSPPPPPLPPAAFSHPFAHRSVAPRLNSPFRLPFSVPLFPIYPSLILLSKSTRFSFPLPPSLSLPQSLSILKFIHPSSRSLSSSLSTVKFARLSSSSCAYCT